MLNVFSILEMASGQMPQCQYSSDFCSFLFQPEDPSLGVSGKRNQVRTSKSVTSKEKLFLKSGVTLFQVC